MRYRNNLKGALSYRSYVPTLLGDYTVSDSPALRAAVEDTEAAFAELAAAMPSAGDQALRSLMEDEARASYRLSETRPRPCFSFGLTVGLNPDEKNILRATDYGVDALNELPLGTRLIKNIHYLVCHSSDYDKKYRGEIRTSPVWVGLPGAKIDEAGYIPPVDDDLAVALHDLDNFMNRDDMNAFVKAAMVHYQFEMIHPFIDANGRVGRILNTLCLYDDKRLAQPVLQLSQALEQDYRKYTDSIQATNDTADMELWLLYFLPVLSEAARLTARLLSLA
ncbi:MAG: Fic family protein [Bacteroides sp.]|nr:Fic family protein [Bacteroides sp.]